MIQSSPTGQTGIVTFESGPRKKRDISTPNLRMVRSEGGRLCCDFNSSPGWIKWLRYSSRNALLI